MSDEQLDTQKPNVGDTAPDFNLQSSRDTYTRLSDLRGQPVVLVFYPYDWSPVCGDQLAIYNEILDLFEFHKAQIFGISTDSVWSHAAYSDSKKLRFPLLADFEPKGEVARTYNVYDSTEGMAERALFVIDSQRIIRWRHKSPIWVNPGADGILAALEALEDQRV